MAVCPNCRESSPQPGGPCPRCDGFHYIPEAAIEDAQSDPIIGRLAATKYVILELINEGGMGAVYRAIQLPVEREVAFKVLRTELKDSDNGRDRFIREARAVSRLNHPNIITLYDFGFEEGRHPYMVMEYAPGKGMDRWMRTEALTTDRILRVTAQILSALTEAHSHGIVHRDLKPENMIISPKANDPDRVKLLDFGIARIVEEGSQRGITREGEVFGTPHYMAPEQAQGKKDIGPPADIYAVGIMLWEMLCGRCPFDAQTPLAVLFMHINDPIPELTPREGLVIPAGLPEVIGKATSKEPQNRYQTASEMMHDISVLFGAVTGSQGAMMFEGSAEYAMAQGSPPPGYSSHTGSGVSNLGSGVTAGPTQTPIPVRGPLFTPIPNEIGSGVHVTDPAPTEDGDRPAFAANFDTAPPPDTPPPLNMKLVFIAFLLVGTAIGTAAVLIFTQTTDVEEAAAAETTIEQPEQPDPAELAIKVEPLPEAEQPEDPAEPEPAAAPDAGSAADAAATDEQDPPAEIAAAEPAPEPKRKRRTRKTTKSKPKAEEVVAAKTAEPKKTEEKKTEEKKATFKPTKFEIKPQKFERVQ